MWVKDVGRRTPPRHRLQPEVDPSLPEADPLAPEVDALAPEVDPLAPEVDPLAPEADSSPPADGTPTCDASVRMLGRFAIGVGDAWVDGWGGQRPRTLLQYLVLRRLPVHREVLMELLWPGYSYASARNNLNVCLYSLRRTVGTAPGGRQLVIYRDGCYSLNPDLDWDVDRDRFVAAANAFRRLDATARFGDAMVAGARAVAAYGGPLFDGDPVADWYGPERVQLHETYLDVLERLAELDLDDGDVGGAEIQLRRLLRNDACRESAHRLLMSCFAHRGQRDLVVRQFRRCVAVLQGELEVEPSPQTIELFRRLVEVSPAPAVR